MDCVQKIQAAGEFTRLMRQLNTTLLYVNNLTGLAPALAAKRLSIPCIWHLRELFRNVGGEMREPCVGGLSLVRWLLRRLSDRIVVVSNAVRQGVVGDRTGVPVDVLPNAVFPAYFEESRSRMECRRQLELLDDILIVGVPGSLRPMKGHEFFLDAAKRVAQQIPTCQFAITGSGSPAYQAGLVEMVKQAGMQDRVRFLGNVDDMSGFYRACDVICVPSRSDPFPRAVIEPFAIGTPVIASAVGGIPEAIEHGRTGLLVPYGDVDALGNGLIALLEHASLRERLAATAREKAWSEYREQVHRERVLRIVEDVTTSS